MPLLSTIAAFGFADIPSVPMLRLYRRLGCVSCQYYRNEANPPTVAEVMAACRDAAVGIDSMHGVFGPAYDPSSPDPAIRADSVRVYREEGSLARQLGGPMVVVHPAPFLEKGQTRDPAQTPARLQALSDSMRELALWASEIGVIYLLENLPGNSHVGNHPHEVADVVRQIDSPHLRMCFDLGHAHITGDAADALRRCADVIGYIHVHDNDGVNDSHLMPGEGTIRWPDIAAALRDAALAVPVMLEVFQSHDAVSRHLESGLADRLVEWLALDQQVDA